MSEIRDLMGAQRQRAVATILTELERVAWPNLPKDKQQHLRTVVINALGRYHDLALDVLRVYANDKDLVNEEVLPLLRQVHSDLRKMHAERTFEEV